MTALLISSLFLIASGGFRAVQDALRLDYNIIARKFGKSFFGKPSETWRNKYKNGDPDNGERFPGSTTLFVALTDGWHLTQSISQSFTRLAFATLATFATALPESWVTFVITFFAVAILQNIPFEIVFRKLRYENRTD